MNLPLDYDRGLAKLLQIYSPGNISLVKITSSREGHLDQVIEILSRGLLRKNQFPADRVYEYTPPPNKSIDSREEKIPRINNITPESAYVILDDILESGTTLRYAVNALKKQRIKARQIYYMGHISQNLEHCFLDKASVILRYASTLELPEWVLVSEPPRW
ncbi:MAG TPA: hypothetical protein VI564_01685 [Candidatus Nanoarchaeia archaeon]|nr:hypothetical protein [Candidatus Nanoarchaeia archaeon]